MMGEVGSLPSQKRLMMGVGWGGGDGELLQPLTDAAGGGGRGN